MTAEVLALVEIVWEFMHLGHTPVPADLMVVFGTNDLRVATLAAKLYREQLAPLALTTGGIAHQGDLLATRWPEPEAAVFAAELVRAGVPEDRILIEPRATNTAENVRFSRELVKTNELRPRNIVAVVKPFMQRRVAATLAVEWPEMPFSLATWETTFAGYCTAELPREKVANILLGDFQRIAIYAGRGYSAPQRIPDQVNAAFARLVELGYDQHLISGGGTGGRIG